MSKFTTVISPATAIDRIMQTGNNPIQFISRAYRDHSVEWAREFEALAYFNMSVMHGMSPAKTIEYLGGDVDLELFVAVVERIAIKWVSAHWLFELSELAFNEIYQVKDIDHEWNFTCEYNYQNSVMDLFPFSYAMNGGNHQCSIMQQLSDLGYSF